MYNLTEDGWGGVTPYLFFSRPVDGALSKYGPSNTMYKFMSRVLQHPDPKHKPYCILVQNIRTAIGKQKFENVLETGSSSVSGARNKTRSAVYLTNSMHFDGFVEFVRC